MSATWFEVWSDETHDVPYLLILRPHPGGYEILDPKEGDRVVFSSANMADARNWLAEDEFELVGRKSG